jgi:prephenate dehydrogenase
VRTKRLQRIKSFFSEQLGLIVLEKTALQHDKEMAQVQALTQFIARALNKLPLRDSEQKTQSFQLLLDLKQMLSFETDDLFFALERENPFAKRERKKFVALLQKIEKEI